MASPKHVKLFWGAVDVSYADESSYAPADVHSMGSSALPPGIGVRRASLVFDRSGLTPAEDKLVTNIDFVNFTAGAPDDTWTDADFSSLEARLSTFWQAFRTYVHNQVVLDQIRWYRVGAGATPPNPAVRVTEYNVFGGGTGGPMPPQVAITLTERTASRRQWGRMYLPCSDSAGTDSAAGRIKSSAVDAIAAGANALYTGAASDDFAPVVFSPTRGKAYTVEKVQVDNLYDVMRSRRYSTATYKKIYDL